MMIRMGKVGKPLVDYTNMLIEDADLHLESERERDVFLKVVPDVQLTFSNISGLFTNLFKNELSSARWEVEISDKGRVLFLGELKNSEVEFDMSERKFAIKAYDKSKVFFEQAKQIKIWKPNSKAFLKIGEDLGSLLSKAYIPVSEFIPFILDYVPPLRELFRGYSISQTYAGKNIRFILSAEQHTNPAIGNEGRYIDLNPEMKIYDLLEAMAKHYNAEFFIDPETRNLVMRKRNDISFTRPGIVTLRDDVTLQIAIADSEKYDYILLAMKLRAPGKPALFLQDKGSSYAGATTPQGAWSYRVVFKAKYGTLEVSSDPGEESSAMADIIFSKPLITLTIPIGPPGTTAREIYRQQWEGNFGSGEGDAPHSVDQYYLIGIVNDNTTTSFDDVYKPDTKKYLPNSLKSSQIWIGYNEETSSWNTIKDDGTNQAPSGKVLDLIPKLEFMAPNNPAQSLGSQPYYNQAFFGGENDFDLSVFQDRWIDFFKTKRKLTCGLIGSDFRDGDRVTLPAFDGSELLGTNEMRIKRVSIELLNERVEEAELITL